MLRLAIIGDPHFVQADHVLAAGSHLKFDPRGDLVPKQALQHPWASLDELTSRPECNRADLVLCVGDLSSGGDQLALGTGWKYLNLLASKLSAELMACATGNHDVRSRSALKEVQQNPVRALGNSRGLNANLHLLHPPYPIVDLRDIAGIPVEALRTNYFGSGFVMVTTAMYRLVVLNSCFEHTADNVDYEKGVFPPYVERDLRRALEQSTASKINILICHHPPTSHGYFGENNYDFITNGGQMLRALPEH